jgi:hypothetical protein
MPRTPDPEDVGRLVDVGTALHNLTQYPEWETLVRTMQERKEVHMRALTKRIMRGDARYLVTVEEQLRHAGFWEGVMAVLETPGNVEKRLKKMLDTLEGEAQQEEEA